MIHILICTGKIIGILLLAILVFVLLVLLLLLFFPFCYRIRAEKEQEGLEHLYADAGVSWLFGLVSAKAVFERKQLEFRFSLLGISLEQWKKLRRWIRKDSKKKPESKSEMSGYPDTSEQREDTGKKEEKTEEKNLFLERTLQILYSFFQLLLKGLLEGMRILLSCFLFLLGLPVRVLKWMDSCFRVTEKIKRNIRKWIKFVKSPAFRNALIHVRGEAKRMWKEICPKKAYGKILFGFEDPSVTGQLLGMISMFYAWLPRELDLIPAFDQQIFRCDFTLCGRIYGFALAGIAWRLFRDRNLKKVIDHLKQKEA